MTKLPLSDLTLSAVQAAAISARARMELLTEDGNPLHPLAMNRHMEMLYAAIDNVHLAPINARNPTDGQAQYVIALLALAAKALLVVEAV